jgi:hypothetical protein
MFLWNFINISCLQHDDKFKDTEQYSGKGDGTETVEDVSDFKKIHGKQYFNILGICCM